MQGWHVYYRILYIPMLECGYRVVALKTKFALEFLFHVMEICINMLLSIFGVTSLVKTIPLYSLLYDILSKGMLDVCGHKHNFLLSCELRKMLFLSG